MTERFLFFTAAVLMLIEAVGYSIGALRPMLHALSGGDSYWNRRLLLNLMLANEALYYSAVLAGVGAFVCNSAQGAGRAVMILSLLSCLYTVVTVPIFTSSDSVHALPRLLAGVMIGAGLVLRS